MIGMVKGLSAEESVRNVSGSLDTMLGRVERGQSLLGTVRDLLIDYCYGNNCPFENGKLIYPREIKIAMDIIKLVSDDMKCETDIICQNERELQNAIDRITE